MRSEFRLRLGLILGFRICIPIRIRIWIWTHFFEDIIFKEKREEVKLSKVNLKPRIQVNLSNPFPQKTNRKSFHGFFLYHTLDSSSES